LTWTSCFLKFTKKVTSSQTIKRYTQIQNLKWIQRTMKKKFILVLQRVNFCFQNTWQSKDYIFQITCVRYLIKKKKLDFQKVFSKKGHLWFHFNKLDFEQTWSLKYESWFQNKGDYWTQKNIDWVCEILDRNDINAPRHSLKSWAAESNTMDPEKEKISSIQNSYEAMKDD
jgi:hypothetical protein